MKNQSHFCKVEVSFFCLGRPQTRFAARVFLSSCGAFIVQSIKVTGEPSTRIMQRRGEVCSAFIHFFNFTAPHFLSFFSCRAGCRHTSTAPENSWFEEHLNNFFEVVRATVYNNSWQSASWDCWGRLRGRALERWTACHVPARCWNTSLAWVIKQLKRQKERKKKWRKWEWKRRHTQRWLNQVVTDALSSFCCVFFLPLKKKKNRAIFFTACWRSNNNSWFFNFLSADEQNIPRICVNETRHLGNTFSRSS